VPVPNHPEDDLTIGPGAQTPAPKIAARFVPGAVLAGRYRLVALVGRGGMGEVYRADDLTLDHPVALKFLPDGVAHDPARLAQFHNELRIARQVSHKNVCRLYDLGDADGRQFITMEYVDGEDLASLLRRIGRLPHDKGVEIARQLCAGLAAAHERGVLHRDLKPANIMLDGEGNVRIADFGLAIADSSDDNVANAGTPQYMAPEQLAGQPASVKSDLYALGLVLFEIFTGRRAYDAKTFNDLVQLHQSGTITTPSSVVRNLDPAIERVILRCLARDPAERPASALAVAAALPGGDPLAAALAAGETPSPEMVAAAGATSAFNPLIGVTLVAVVVAGLMGLAMLCDTQLLVARAPLDTSIDALEGRAREIVATLGYAERPVDTAHGIGSYGEYVNYVARTNRQPSRWDGLATGYISPLRFWYRSSPRDMIPLSTDTVPSVNDPPHVISNMVTAVLDTRGRLSDLLAVAPQLDTSAAAAAPTDWTPLFTAAALPFAEFHRVDSQWTPRVYADERAAWEGPMPGEPATRLRVEAAAYRGKAVSFQIIGPWTTPTRMQQTPKTTSARVIAVIGTALALLLLAAAIALARYNLRVGRGDRRGAWRLALFMLGVFVLAWAFGARHRADLQVESNDFFIAVALALLNVGILWLLYVALEPYVRRYCPDLLFSWSRLLGGQIRDPRVGRDILIGVATGVFVTIALFLFRLTPMLSGGPAPVPKPINYQFLLGSRYAIAAVLRIVPNAMQNAMFTTLVFVVTRAVTGRLWAAAAVAIAFFGIFVAGEAGDSLLFNVLFSALFSGAFVFTLMYFGLLAQVAAFFVQQLLVNGVLTADMSKMYAATSVWLMLTIAGLAAFGFYASRAGQPLFGHLLPRE
jgi:hypothetical protein